MLSMWPRRNSTFVAPARALFAFASVEHVVGHVEAVRLARRTNALGGEQDVDAAARAEVEHRLAFAQVGERRGVAAAERRKQCFGMGMPAAWPSSYRFAVIGSQLSLVEPQQPLDFRSLGHSTMQYVSPPSRVVRPRRSVPAPFHGACRYPTWLRLRCVPRLSWVGHGLESPISKES